MRIRNTYSKSEDILDEEIDFIASVSDALAHPARIKMFRYIASCNKERKEVRNKDLVAQFDYAQATISQHMKALVKSGLVDVKQDKQSSCYYVNLGTLARFLDTSKKI